MKAKGISLIENLISMSLFLLIVLGSLEVFSLARNHFFELKHGQETHSAALAALDKIKADLQQCGLGLFELSGLGLIEPLHSENNILTLVSVEKKYLPAVALVQGQTRIPLDETRQIKKGKELGFLDGEKGEIKTVSSVDKTGIFLSSPLVNSYAAAEVSVCLLNRIVFYLDENKDTLRRKVNSSPAQPLCEGVKSFECFFEPLTNLVKLRLCLDAAPEKNYETSLFPKNTALASRR